MNDGVGFSQYYPQYYFSPANLDSPLNIKYVNYFTYINPSTSFDYQLYWKSYSLEDDLGWILKDKIVTSVLAFDYIEKGLGFLGIQGSKKVLYFQSIFYTSSEKILFHRSYMKIQELAALVGGFMQMLLFIAGQLIRPFSYFQLNKNLINNILDQDQRLPSISKLAENSGCFKKLSNPAAEPDNSKDSQSKINNFITNELSLSSKYKAGKLEVPTFAEYMLSKVNCKKKSEQIANFELARKSLRNKMDIVTILKGLRRSNLIASLFLNSSQHSALNFVQRQSISTIAAELEVRNETLESSNVIKYFQNRQKDNCLTSLDNSLYLMLNDELKKKIGMLKVENIHDSQLNHLI